MKKRAGFTLIEVLLALMIVAIALTALLQAIGYNITNTSRLKDKSVSHVVAMQAVTMLQLGLLNPPLNQEISQKTQMLGQTWYWRVKLTPTSIKAIQQINLTLSSTPTGPFRDPLLSFRYKPYDFTVEE